MVAYNFGVELMRPTRQHLVNSGWVFVDDKSEASVNTDHQSTVNVSM